MTVSLAAGMQTGCQVGSQPQQSMVSSLPSPNFNGPRAVESPRPVPALPQATPAPVRPAPAPQARLTAPRDWVPPVAPRNWQYIVIHHSATPAGGAARFDREHREKGWDELGYDFVIGNGTDTADGQVEVGSRWVKQKIGAHAKTPDNRFNEHGIGICLVGNFDVERPTAAQMRSVARLVAFMMRQYHIPAENVIGHKQTKPTECPGTHLSIAEVRRMAAQTLAAAGGIAEPNARPARAEMLVDVQR